MRTPTALARAVLGFALVAAALVVTAPAALANPIGPNLWACDGAGHLFEVYVLTDAHHGNPTWFCFHICDLSIGEAGAVELEGDVNAATCFVQSLTDGPKLQRFGVQYGGCAPLGAAVEDGHAFTGLELRGATLWAVDTPPDCSGASLWQIDMATGTVMRVGATGFGALEGLGWDPTRLSFFALATCPAGTAQLVAIDPATGAGTLVGDTRVAGLASLECAGALVAGTDAAHGGQLYLLDPETASATLIPGPDRPALTEFAGMAGTGYGIVPTRRPSWGHVKSLYR